MQPPTFDPGLTQKYTGALKRVISEKGEFNVQRRGSTWRDIHPYLVAINASWTTFAALVFAVFAVTNVVFAALYMAIGIDHLKGADGTTGGLQFVNAFFFSTHTLTTVGYGNIYPVGPAANSLAAIEALVGLLGFAVITGLMFGRFSKPSARIGFSKSMLVTPYGDGLSLQFRIVNRRTNNLLELSARILLMTVENGTGGLQRKYIQLTLERDQVLFFPLTWTVVHPITESSPLYGKTPEDLEGLQAEVMILIKAFDDTFGQTVNVRHSYRHDEIVWGGKFASAFVIDQVGGDLQLEVDKVSSFEPVSLPRLQ
jgi:inward rectifier potassium channel